MVQHLPFKKKKYKGLIKVEGREEFIKKTTLRSNEHGVLTKQET